MTATTTPDARAPSRPDHGASWLVRSFGIVIGVSVLGGLAAALAGGSLTGLGEGAGGLYGVPSLATTALALAALPTAVLLARRAQGSPRRLRLGVTVAAGAWIVAVGYFAIAHAVDPCINGWWDANSTIGDQPLCERFGAELNWHTRFHLLAHAGPAALLLAGYWWAVRRA